MILNSILKYEVIKYVPCSLEGAGLTLRRCGGGTMKKVSTPWSRRYEDRSSPWPASTSYSPESESRVARVTCTRPGSPPDSMWLARVTSLDQTSNCHFRRPRTPQSTRPVWMPTRMFRMTSVASTTVLFEIEGNNFIKMRVVDAFKP